MNIELKENATKKSEAVINAEKWLDWLKTEHNEQLVRTAIDTTWHTDDFVEYIPQRKRYTTTVTDVYNTDVVTCAYAAYRRCEANDKICILDFASYTHPGGGFERGAMAQEESLCGSSALFPVLYNFRKIYDDRRNKDPKNKYANAYQDDFFYTVGMPFWLGSKRQECFIDVMVMAAPNRSALPKDADSEVVDHMLRNRMKKIFLYPAMQGCSILILGAFGCGVFKNDPAMVAKEWHHLTEKYDGLYSKVIHPVTDKQMYDTFRREYGIISKTAMRKANRNKK